MKIGIISDIHSNIIAFRAVIRELEAAGCDEYLLLGDYVSDTPYTKETMEALHAFINTHICHLLRGNREEYMLAERKNRREGNTDAQWLWNSASGNLLFAYNQLTEADLDFFESLPITFTYCKEGYPSITCCHGSPINARELCQLDGENTQDWLHQIATDYMICAHTHFPGAASYEGKLYCNAGCVGISIEDVGNAQCMILESAIEGGKTIWKPTFLHIPYDYKQVVRDFFTRGLFDSAPWFACNNLQILLTGIDQSLEFVTLANKLAGPDAVWPHIEEGCFAEAAGQVGMKDYSYLKNE